MITIRILIFLSLFRDAMTTWGARSSQRPLTSDIGAFVEKYQKLVDLLFPFTAASDAVLYIVRYSIYQHCPLYTVVRYPSNQVFVYVVRYPSN